MDGVVVALTYVIAYDITDDRRRSQVAAVLQAYGDRVQRSVFVCTAEPELIAEIRSRLAGIIKPEADSVYVFRQRAACWDAVGHPRPGGSDRRTALLGGAVGGSA
jgi:CRISPR-associated protein Cas2